jgi:hypothetical protein
MRDSMPAWGETAHPDPPVKYFCQVTKNDIREVPGVPRIWAIVKATNMVSSTNKNEKGK